MPVANSGSEEQWLALARRFLRGEMVPDWRPLASSAHARVYYGESEGAYLKLFQEPRWRNRLKAQLIPALSRYRCFVRQSDRLRRQGLHAPAVLGGGSLERRWGYVVTEAFPGVGMGTLCARYLSHRGDRYTLQWKWRMMAALGEEVARLHNRGIVHGDLRPDNVLLHARAKPPRFCFIDNERNHHYSQHWPRRPPRRGVVKNLSQLNMLWPEDLPAGDRLRVLRAYVRHAEIQWEWRDLARCIHRISRRRLAGRRRGGYRKGDEPVHPPDFAALLDEGTP